MKELIESLQGRSTGWVTDLPEVGTPILRQAAAIEELRDRLTEAERQLKSDVLANWTKLDINKAKNAAHRASKARIAAAGGAK